MSISKKEGHENKDEGQTVKNKLVLHRGFYLISGIHSPEEVDSIQDLEIRDSDVFVITYPKSGTIWMQQILSLIEGRGDVTVTMHKEASQRIPWLEDAGGKNRFAGDPSPRLRVSHLDYKFMPRALKQKRGKVIYLARNPKDILVSYFHFHYYAAVFETPENFSDFFEKFLEGRVFCGRWFDHIKTWYSHKDEMNFLYLTYEEMIQDLRAAVERISMFMGKELINAELDSVAEHSTFDEMSKNPYANYRNVSDELLHQNKGAFMRKGTIGDWKNHFTREQNERFDHVFREEMKDFPLKFVWDINDIKV
ncbi:amine sulfotransferase-like [Scleropages formosus]|uniref:amine sulfotransferase-like n=1 Tax=Scleropages formosus TaxID=113540 RepID=UPI0008785434|nr:amine sulfotransferase-like [Scleropages formosus]XP_029110154.1 amine sulfotransferase-like [Scleropages formosus]